MKLQEQEIVVEKEGERSGSEGDAVKKSSEMSEAEMQTGTSNINSETDAKLVQMDEETRKEEELELGSSGLKVRGEAQDEGKGQDDSIAREGDKDDEKKRVVEVEEQDEKKSVVEGEEQDVKDEDVQSKVDANEGEKQVKLEKSSNNSEKEEEGKKEKTEKSEKQVSSNSHPEVEKSEEKEKKKDKEEKKGEEKEKKKGKGEEKEEMKEKKKEKGEEKEKKKEKGEEKEKKKEKSEEKEKKKEKSEEKEKKKEKSEVKEKEEKKKDKKGKSSSERIQKKLEKINAKIGRILAKKEEYELRLQEALERQRQESEKAERREASTTATEKSANDTNRPDPKREKSIGRDELSKVEDASSKGLNKSSSARGLSGSLSRTASLLDASPAELMEEVAIQKKVAEELSDSAVRDGSEVNPRWPTEDPDAVMAGKEKVLHALQVDDSKDIEAS